MATLLNTATLGEKTAQDFSLFAKEMIRNLVCDNDFDEPEDKIEELYKEFGLCLSHLCAAMHHDLARGEASECYDPVEFWSEKNAETMACGEATEMMDLLNISAAGAGIHAIMDHIFENHL